jgi:hypothetical protein
MKTLSSKYCHHRSEDGVKCKNPSVWQVRGTDTYVCRTHGVHYYGQLVELRPLKKRYFPIEPRLMRELKQLDHQHRQISRGTKSRD